MAAPAVMASASWGAPVCVPDETPELSCEDGADNDCDALIDCDDPDCAAAPACVVPQCDGDGVCEPGEDCMSCASDCDGKLSGGKPWRFFCCGDGVVAPREADGSMCDGNP